MQDRSKVRQYKEINKRKLFQNPIDSKTTKIDCFHETLMSSKEVFYWDQLYVQYFQTHFHNSEMFSNTPNYPPNYQYQQNYQQPPPFQQPQYQQPYHQQQPYQQQPIQQPYQPNYHPPQQQQPQQIIIVQNQSDNSKEKCPYCNSSAGFVTENVIGSMVIMMFCIFLICTGVCCFVAYLVDEWYDKDVKCMTCSQVIRTLPAGG